MDQEIQKQPSPWAKRREIGLFKALWQTIKQVLLTPGKFFASLEIADSFKGPILFAVTIWAPLFTVLLWEELLLRGSFKLTKMPPNNFIFPVTILILLAVFILFLILFIYVFSGIMHLCVKMLKGKGGFKGTLNIFTYSSATSIFNIAPFIGGIISFIWCLIVIIIGLKKVHKFSTGRAIASYCLSIVFSVVLAFIVGFAFAMLRSAIVKA
jgi:hypothetical protein